jgi:predicted enzyme related to lactoylglutathione lyase
MNPVVHFEFPAEDSNRMAKFYTDAFGWKTQQLGEEMGNYVLATTCETNDKGHPKNPGTINGGFYNRRPEMPDDGPSVVIAVNDINDAVNKIKAAGGKVLGEPMMIPGVGMYVSFTDTEGNRNSVLQPTGM